MVKAVAKSTSNSEQITTTEPLSKSTYFTISVDRLYQFNVLKYMKPIHTLNPPASMQYVNIYNNPYTVVIHENKYDFIDLFTELDAYNSDLYPIENYTIVQEKMFKEIVDNSRSEDYGLIVINGYSARQVKMIGNKGVNVAYVITFIKEKDKLFTAMKFDY